MPRHLKLVALLALLFLSQHLFAQRIFWTEPMNNRVRFGTLTFSGITSNVNFLSGLPSVQKLSLDQSYNLIFFTPNNGNSLYQANYNSSGGFERYIYGAMSEATDIDYSTNNNGVYATIYEEARGMTFVPETSGGSTQLDLDGNGDHVLSCLTVDDGSERVFFYDEDDDAIYYTGFADDGLTLVRSGTGLVTAMDFDETANKLVYATETNQIILCNANGSSPVPLTTASGFVSAVDYYAGYGKVYYVAANSAIWSVTDDGVGTNEMLMSLPGTGVYDIGVEPDQTLPTVTSRYPANGQSGITIGETFTLDFTETVRKSPDAAVGSQRWIRVFKTVGNVPVDTIDRDDPRLTFFGASISLSNLGYADPLTDYYILIGNRVIEDMAGNNFVGFNLASQWGFTSSVNETKFYSRQSGDWHDLNTWSHEGHGGATTPVTNLPGTGADVEIGPGHIVTMQDDATVVGATTGLLIQTGGALDMNTRTLTIWGDFRIEGTLRGDGVLSGIFELYSTELPVFQRIDVGTDGIPGEESGIHRNVVAYDGVVLLDGGILNTNGFQVCTPPSIPTTPVYTNITGTSTTLSWSPGAGTAFIVLRESTSSASKPKFEMDYLANAIFPTGDDVGSSNFVIYKATGSTVTITGLSPATSYDLDMYGSDMTIGGCYSLNNYQTGNFTTCINVAAPTNPVDATYCTGEVKPPIRVDNPGSGKNINWYDAATGGNVVTGDLTGGSGRGEIFIPTAASGTFYAETYDGTFNCTSPTRLAVTLTVLPSIATGLPSASQNICSGGDPTILNGGVATGGTGTFTYQWSSSTTAGGPYTDITGAMNPTFDPPAGLMATTYFVRTVHSSTCSRPGAEIAVNVVSDPIISADPAADFACGSEASSFRVVAVGITLTYQWQVDNGSGFTNVANGGVYSGATIATLSIANSTGLNGFRYRCIVTESASCSVTSSAALLTVNNLPAAIDVPVSGCETVAGSGTLQINLLDYNDEVTGNDATSGVTWYTDNTFTSTVPAPDNVFATTGRTYHARVFGGNTCTDDAQLTVTVTSKPEVSPAPSDKTICSGTSTALTYTSAPAGASYTWTVSSNNKVTGAANGNGASINQSLTNTAATQQQVTYTITPSLNGCAGANFIQNVLVDPIPTIFNISGGGTICSGATASINLSGSQAAVEYSLYRDNVFANKSIGGNGSAIAFNDITQAGTYTVRASTAADCNGNMNGSAVVIITTTPTGTGVIAGLSQLCVGAEQTYTIGGITGATLFSWSLPSGLEAVSPSTTASIKVRATGTVSGSISVTPSNACGAGTGATIGSLGLSSLPQPEIEIDAPEKIFAEEPATFTYTTNAGILDQVWDFGDGHTSSDATGINTYAAGGDYTVSVTVTSQNGCPGTASITVSVNPVATLGDLAIKNVVTANGDRSNDLLYIENLEKFLENEVIVIDRWGTEVFRKKDYQNDWDFKKSGEYLPAGNYVCVLKSDGKTYSRVVTVIK